MRRIAAQVARVRRLFRRRRFWKFTLRRGCNTIRRSPSPVKLMKRYGLFNNQHDNMSNMLLMISELYSMLPCLQPDTVTGDIVFVLQQKDHSKFKRKGDDLFYEHTLSLTEALCGFQFVLTHLDNRQLLIKSNPGEVVKPGKALYPHIFSAPCTFAALFVANPWLINLSRPIQGDKRRGDANVPEAFHEGEALHSLHCGIP